MENNASNHPKLVFLVGHPRSGTTWLMWLLSHHPEIVGCNHAGFFHAILPLQKWWGEAEHFGKNIHVFSGDNPPQYKRADLTQIMGNVPFGESIRPAAWAVFNTIAAAKPGARIILEQTPENLRFYETVLEVFPEAYFLHAIRDPRAVVASMRGAVSTWASPFDFPNHPIQITRDWSVYQQLGRDLAARTPNYRTIQYEALQTEGVREVMGILNWLGATATPEKAEEYLRASTLDQMNSEKGLMPKGFFRKGKAQGWRDDLSVGQIQAVEFTAGAWMEQYGYARMYPAGRTPWLVRRYRFGQKVRALFSGGLKGGLKKKVFQNRALNWVWRRVRSVQMTFRRMK